MKVLHVYRTYFPDPPGGLQEVIRQIGLSTKDLGVETRIFTLTLQPNQKIINFPEGDVYRAKETFELASCNVSFGCLSLFKSCVEWADIVHYHFPWPFADLLHFWGGVRKPCLVTYHSDVVRQKFLLKPYMPLMRAFLSRVDAIIATSKNYVDSSQILTEFKDKVSTIPIGISDYNYAGFLPKEIALPLHFRTDGFFLFVGVLRYYKGLHVLLEALRGSSANCVIAGVGPEESSLKKQAEKLGLSNVFFVGFVDDEEKKSLLSQCRGLVFPSHLRSEAYGVALLEGAMFSKPLISCEIGTGTSFVNKNDVSGFVVPPSDANALRNALNTLSSNPDLSARLGRGARDRYLNNFTASKMGSDYVQIYRRLLDSHG